MKRKKRRGKRTRRTKWDIEEEEEREEGICDIRSNNCREKSYSEITVLGLEPQILCS